MAGKYHVHESRRKAIWEKMTLEEAMAMLQDVYPCGAGVRWSIASKKVSAEVLRLRADNAMLIKKLEEATNNG